ncbi:hypothetical protein ElyMa_005711000 [Elysia marginata]|uniref:Uncharacterized protein n=1 Tax=Elysia marginata TaxID=1093978 RepID=A0AAV4FH97_9GAST|nr:hypothetical protein ElyMa_005711000 [Elysia marginata]
MILPKKYGFTEVSRVEDTSYILQFFWSILSAGHKLHSAAPVEYLSAGHNLHSAVLMEHLVSRTQPTFCSSYGASYQQDTGYILQFLWITLSAGHKLYSAVPLE